MPIYEYNCENCRSDFELLIRGDEQPACPECGATRLVKQFSVPAAHSAGGGSLSIADMPRPGPCGRGGCGRPECD